jgi:hypothetical protein
VFNRTSIFALTAVAALGMTALATSNASARAVGAVGGMHGAVAAHGPMGVSIKAHGPMGIAKPNKPVVTGLIIKPNKPIVNGIIIKPKPPVITGIIINKPWHPHHNWCKWHYCGPNWVIGGGLGVVSTGVVSTGVIASTPVAASAPAPTCTCLTKTYLQDGSVLFKDVCTTEMAIAPADQKASAN